MKKMGKSKKKKCHPMKLKLRETLKLTKKRKGVISKSLKIKVFFFDYWSGLLEWATGVGYWSGLPI
jgi:hypothetical protein